MLPCYVATKGGKENQNEKSFVKYLEENDSVAWWYKNGDHGADYFSVKKDSGGLFFPDWFVKTKQGDTWILDTKGGYTAEGDDAMSKARALEEWLQQNSGFRGGLVKKQSDVWRIAIDSRLRHQDWKDLELR